MDVIEIVAATRLTADEFRSSPLGMSLARLARDPRLKPQIAFSNTLGLPAVYNRRIDAVDKSDVLLFVHDDVWFEDFYISDRILAGLKEFDVIGLAGNRRLAAGHESWAYAPGADRLDLPHLAGAIAHGDAPLGKVGFFGPIVAPVELLDGVFIAGRKQALSAAAVRFDPRFDFHFYDLDFCRTARRAGLKLGTWPIAVTHRSTGNPYSPAWHEGLAVYREKWPD